MTLNSPFSVRIEQPATRLGEIMSEIRSWLDRNKIEPVEFKTLLAVENSVALDIQFHSQDEAFLFEREFAWPQPTSQSPVTFATRAESETTTRRRPVSARAKAPVAQELAGEAATRSRSASPCRR